jgi:hypothetical protein
MVHLVVASTKDTTKEGDVKVEFLGGKSNNVARKDNKFNVYGHDDKTEAKMT